MKGQGLPMTTIVLVIIAVVALVVVILFFFSGFGGGTNSTSTFLDIGSERTSESRCQATLFGSPCPTAKPYCNPENGVCLSSVALCPSGKDDDGDKICD